VTTSRLRSFILGRRGLLKESRSFTNFSDPAQQRADSRIFGSGVHFRFDSEASQAYCAMVPEFTAEHFMLVR